MESKRLDELATLVYKRLSLKRVGFLWRGAPSDFDDRAGVTWVHYYYHCGDKRGVTLPRAYDLGKLRDPMAEGRTLHMLTVLRGSPGVLLEVASGVVVSPASALVDGAMKNGVPVLFDASSLREWCASPEAKEERNKRWKTARRITNSLQGRGMEFLGFEETTDSRNSHGETGMPGARLNELTLRNGGWLSWSELAPLVAGADVVRLARGTKLTPEAADRLMKLNVRVEEV